MFTTCGRRIGGVDPGAGREPELTDGDDLLTGFEPAGDDRIVTFGAQRP